MHTNVFQMGLLAAGLLIPAAAWAQGLQLKPGGNYAIAFPDTGNGANGNGNGPGSNNAPAPNGPFSKGVALCKVVGAADQNWYRVRPMVRTPQGMFVPMPGVGEIWVNLNYALWVQEVAR